MCQALRTDPALSALRSKPTPETSGCCVLTLPSGAALGGGPPAPLCREGKEQTDVVWECALLLGVSVKDGSSPRALLWLSGLQVCPPPPCKEAPEALARLGHERQRSQKPRLFTMQLLSVPSVYITFRRFSKPLKVLPHLTLRQPPEVGGSGLITSI